MLAVSSVLAIAMFVVFITLGVQRLIFNDTMESMARRVGFSRRAFTIIGSVEALFAVGLLVGVAGVHGTWQGWVNTASAVVLLGMTLGDVVTNLRTKQSRTTLWPLLGLLALVIAELVLRLA